MKKAKRYRLGKKKGLRRNRMLDNALVVKTVKDSRGKVYGTLLNGQVVKI
jgi:hypothetical protein